MSDTVSCFGTDAPKLGSIGGCERPPGKPFGASAERRLQAIYLGVRRHFNCHYLDEGSK